MDINFLNNLYRRYKKPGTLRIAMIYSIFIAIVIILSVTAYHFNKKQMTYGIRINLAGRQRMYTQKMTKELFLYNYNAISKKQIQSTMYRFESTLNALTHGGRAVMEEETEYYVTLPPTENPRIREQLLSVITLWEMFRHNMEQYMETKSSDSLQYILNNNEKLVNNINNAVYELQVESEHNSRVIRILVISTILIIIGFIAFNLVQSVHKLKMARREIEELEKLLPICSNCKKIRLDDEHPEDPLSWIQVEEYLASHKDMAFSHGLCPGCIKELYPDMARKLKKKK